MMKISPPIPFCIVIDTREQKPLRFPEGTPTIAGTCYPGDYSLVGYRHGFVIERKGVTENHGVWTSDLVGTITELLRGQAGDLERGSLRFRWELKAMANILQSGGIAFVATDRSRSWYAAHAYFGGLHPSALFGTIRSLMADYGVPFLFFDDSEALSNFVLGLAMEYWKHRNGLASYPATPKGEPNANYSKWLREFLVGKQN